MKRFAVLIVCFMLMVALVVTASAQQDFTIYLPSTQRLAFAWDLALVIYPPGGGGVVYRYSLTSQVLQPIASTDQYQTAYFPSWSPDGMRIAYSVTGKDPGIYVYDASRPTPTKITDGVATVMSPTWSPDGERLAYSCWNNGIPQLCVMGSDGSNSRLITQEAGGCWTPAWSPDGAHIACAIQDGETSHICRFAPDGSGRLCVTEPAGLRGDTSPAWSPDSSYITFASDRDGTWALHSVPVDGGPIERIATNTVDAVDPAWSPNGQYLAFASYIPETGCYAVQILDPMGQTIDTIAIDGDVRMPSWR